MKSHHSPCYLCNPCVLELSAGFSAPVSSGNRKAPQTQFPGCGPGRVSSAAAGTAARRPRKVPGQRSCGAGKREGAEQGDVFRSCFYGCRSHSSVVDILPLTRSLRSCDLGFIVIFFIHRTFTRIFSHKITHKISGRAVALLYAVSYCNSSWNVNSFMLSNCLVLLIAYSRERLWLWLIGILQELCI